MSGALRAYREGVARGRKRDMYEDGYRYGLAGSRKISRIRPGMDEQGWDVNGLPSLVRRPMISHSARIRRLQSRSASLPMESEENANMRRDPYGAFQQQYRRDASPMPNRRFRKYLSNANTAEQSFFDEFDGWDYDDAYGLQDFYDPDEYLYNAGMDQMEREEMLDMPMTGDAETDDEIGEYRDAYKADISEQWKEGNDPDFTT